MAYGGNNHSERGELVHNLRHGLRKCSLLALHLVDDPLVGGEVQRLLGRLAAIRSELDAIQAVRPELRNAGNDPFWCSPPPLMH